MARCKIPGVRIGGLVTVVPGKEISLDDEACLFDNNSAQIKRIKETIGLDKRRVVEEDVTACDMAEVAVKTLLEKTDTVPSDIDGIFMVTQTPDYLQPGNAVLLQDRLGFPTTCAAMDLNQGCSGYVYGLWAVHSFLAAGGMRKAILVAGDTISRIVSKEDRALRPLFGDAVSATLLEADADAPAAFFDLNSDGSGYQSLWQPGGAFREPVSDKSSEVKAIGQGIRRSRCHLHMDGADIFNFSLKVGPSSINDVLEFAEWSQESVDGYILHQANRYIIDNIRRRLKLPEEKVPSGTFEKFGNQSSASIPATLNDHYGSRLTEKPHRMVLSGFGVGLSWGSCAIELPALRCNQLIEMQA